MSLLDKLWTALRDGARDLGHSFAGAGDIERFEQEIRAASAGIASAKHLLADIITRRAQTTRQLTELSERLVQLERDATAKLQRGDETQALAIAGRIAELEQERDELSVRMARLDHQSEQLKHLVRQAEQLIADHERELAMVRTTASVQRATEQVVENVAARPSATHSAREVLERIKKRQGQKQEPLNVDALLTGNISEAAPVGISQRTDAAAVLARLKSSPAP